MTLLLLLLSHVLERLHLLSLLRLLLLRRRRHLLLLLHLLHLLLNTFFAVSLLLLQEHVELALRLFSHELKPPLLLLPLLSEAALPQLPKKRMSLLLSGLPAGLLLQQMRLRGRNKGKSVNTCEAHAVMET